MTKARVSGKTPSDADVYRLTYREEGDLPRVGEWISRNGEMWVVAEVYRDRGLVSLMRPDHVIPMVRRGTEEQ